MQPQFPEPDVPQQPWRLTESDVRMLRSLRIDPEEKAIEVCCEHCEEVVTPILVGTRYRYGVCPTCGCPATPHGPRCIHGQGKTKNSNRI